MAHEPTSSSPSDIVQMFKLQYKRISNVESEHDDHFAVGHHFRFSRHLHVAEVSAQVLLLLWNLCHPEIFAENCGVQIPNPSTVIRH